MFFTSLQTLYQTESAVFGIIFIFFRLCSRHPCHKNEKFRENQIFLKKFLNSESQIMKSLISKSISIEGLCKDFSKLMMRSIGMGARCCWCAERLAESGLGWQWNAGFGISILFTRGLDNLTDWFSGNFWFLELSQ